MLRTLHCDFVNGLLLLVHIFFSLSVYVSVCVCVFMNAPYFVHHNNKTMMQMKKKEKKMNQNNFIKNNHDDGARIHPTLMDPAAVSVASRASVSIRWRLGFYWHISHLVFIITAFYFYFFVHFHFHLFQEFRAITRPNLNRWMIKMLICR